MGTEQNESMGFEIDDDRESLDIIFGLSNKSEASDDKQEEEKKEEEVSQEEQSSTEDTQSESDETKSDEEETGEETKEEQVTQEEEDKKEEESKEEENQPNEKLIEVAKMVDPDSEFENDDQAITSIKEKLDELTTYKKESDEANSKLVELFEGEPGLKGFISDVYGGMDPKTAFAVNIDESLSPEEGEEGYEKYKARKEEREKKLKDKKEADQEFEKNRKESEKIISKFKEDKKMDDSQIQEYMQKLDTYVGSIFQGKLNPEFLDIYDKGLRFDQEVKLAEERGKIQAKNEKAIDKKRKQKEQRTMPTLKKSAEKERETKLDPWLEKASRKDKASRGFLT